MSIPAAIFRKGLLYSVIPELEQIDLNIGTRQHRNLDFSNVQTNFRTELSNVTANGGDLSDFYKSWPATMYINSLEAGIINSNALTGTDLSNVFAQKISLLEAAYSNIAPESTTS
jgi:hypothetical protein